MSIATRTDAPSPAPHVADRRDLIRVHGARENNLKDVSVELPKRRLTAFTGVSGSGMSVIVVEHHQAVMARADWIIDLGPGGHDGGRVVFAGTPAALVAARSTLTGAHLAAYVGS